MVRPALVSAVNDADDAGLAQLADLVRTWVRRAGHPID
jgi:hypothetical protein